MRRSSLYDDNIAVSRELDGSYDQIKKVAANVDSILAVSAAIDDGTFDNVDAVATEPLKSNIAAVASISEDIAVVIDRSADIQAVAAINNDVSLLADNITAVQNVVQYIDDIKLVGNAINYVTLVANNIDNVIEAGQNTANINNVSGNMQAVIDVANADIDTIIDNLETIITVGGNELNINAVADSIDSVNTVAGSILNVNSVGDNISNVVAVDTNSDNINTVSSSIDNVNTVATNIDRVNIVNSNISNVITVSNSITDVSTVAGNVASINDVSDNAANINTVSNNMPSVLDVSSEPLRTAILDAETHVDNAQLKAWEAEAERMTADSYATEPENTFVKVYTSNGDGTFSSADTTEYSALHYSNKSQEFAVGSATNISYNNTASELASTNVQDAVDELDSRVDSTETKLSTIEDNATADQTAPEIKALYESNSNTNAFTDALLVKLGGIEAGATADQTPTEILNAIKTVDGAGSELNADLLDGQQGSYYQQALVSGTSIKTINGASILGAGNINTPTVSLSSAINSDSETTAATSKAVKTINDSKMTKPTATAGSKVCFIAGDLPISKAANPYGEIRGTYVPYGGTYTVYFNMTYAKGLGNTTAYARIYVNGSAVGTVRSLALGISGAWSENVTVNEGDRISIYVQTPSSSSTYYGITLNSFRLSANEVLDFV